MVNVGVIGLGMMGNTHLDAYSKLSNANVVAIADTDPDRLTGKTKAEGNVEGQAQGDFDFGSARQYSEGMQLIADEDVQLVDICLITPLHCEFALAALEAGKHVLIEKPLARTYEQAQQIVDAARKAKGLAMPAMCMRFWPGWDWAKEAVDKNAYGKVLSASFRRVAEHPGGPFYSDGARSGGALLDLHIHDTDFVQHCFGLPKAVFSRGYRTVSGAVDHLVTNFIYDDVPMVVAEGGWAMPQGFGFSMSYTINFEQAFAEFTYDGQSRVKLIEVGQEPRQIEFGAEMGYDREIAYFLQCIEQGEAPSRVTLEDAAASIRIAEAQAQSIDQSESVSL